MVKQGANKSSEPFIYKIAISTKIEIRFLLKQMVIIFDFINKFNKRILYKIQIFAQN